jgi:CelD/BcsL family acetyltransferase involved in cellulose biosynthesis
MLASLWLGSQYRYLLALEDGELVGGLPIRLVRRLGFELVSLPKVRYADLLVKEGREKEVASAVSVWLSSRGGRVVRGYQVPEHSAIGAALPRGARWGAAGGGWWAELPSSFDEFLAQRPSQLKHLVEEPSRRLHRAGARFTTTPVNQVALALAEFRRLHRLRWGDEHPFLRTIDALAGVIPRAVEKGLFSINRLELDGASIAMCCNLQFGRLFAPWAQARDTSRHEWRGSGSVVMAEGIAAACTQGYRELDLWSGDEPYKQFWADRRRQIWEFSVGFPAVLSPLMVGLEHGQRRLRRGAHN